MAGPGSVAKRLLQCWTEAGGGEDRTGPQSASEASGSGYGSHPGSGFETQEDEFGFGRSEKSKQLQYLAKNFVLKLVEPRGFELPDG